MKVKDSLLYGICDTDLIEKLFKESEERKTEKEDYYVYEHVCGLPDFLDTINEEITDSCYDKGLTAYEAGKEVERIMKIKDTDVYGRKRNLYVWRA